MSIIEIQEFVPVLKVDQCIEFIKYVGSWLHDHAHLSD